MFALHIIVGHLGDRDIVLTGWGLLVIIFFAPAGLYGIVAGKGGKPQREEGGR